MGYFNIDFVVDSDPAAKLVMGQLLINKDVENFESEVGGYWSILDYRRSWLTAVRRLCDGAELSCIVTSITNPATANFITAWPLYRWNEVIYIQNTLIFLDELNEPYSADEPWRSVGPRETKNEDGITISEWSVKLSDMQEFLERME